MRLEGKTVLVTAAGQGIGRASALAMAATVEASRGFIKIARQEASKIEAEQTVWGNGLALPIRAMIAGE